jgi:type IV secretory pathway VirB10-like protein
MVKRFYTPSLLRVYGQVKSKRSLVFSWVVLAIVSLVIMLSFFGGSKSIDKPLLESDLSPAVETELMHNLQWLNRQSLSVQQEPALVHKVKPASFALSETTKIDPKRLQAAAVIYAHPVVTKIDHLNRVTTGVGARRLLAGEVLHAVLESAIQSDFAGPVRAILSDPAYSYNGMQVVLPAGTRIIGEYQNSIKAAQVRVGIEWKRMILPNGSSIDFSAPATGPMGRVGVAATRVNTHFWRRFGEAGLYSLLSAGSQLAGGASADTLTAGQLLRSQVSSSFADTAMAELEKNKSIAPTIYLDPGAEVSIFVRHDMEF